MESERRSIARTTISKDALLFFDAAARRPHLPCSGCHEFRGRHCTPHAQYAAGQFRAELRQFSHRSGVPRDLAARRLRRRCLSELIHLQSEAQPGVVAPQWATACWNVCTRLSQMRGVAAWRPSPALSKNFAKVERTELTSLLRVNSGASGSPEDTQAGLTVLRALPPGLFRGRREFKMSWDRPFAQPVPLPEGPPAQTLRDAADYIRKLPQSERDCREWQLAFQMLIDAAEDRGPVLFAGMGIVRALEARVTGCSSRNGNLLQARFETN